MPSAVFIVGVITGLILGIPLGMLALYFWENR